MKYTIITVFLASFLLAGCLGINIPGLGGGNVTIVKENATKSNGSIEITNKTNTSTIVEPPQKNGTLPEENNTPIVFPPEQNKTPGAHYKETPNERFAVYLINVGDDQGQGDAIFVKRGDLDILIDAGPARNSGKVIDFLNRRGIDDIDILVSTEADEEHYGGMDAVLGSFPVEEFWWTGKSYGNTKYEATVKKAEDRGALVKTVKRGDVFTLNNLKFNILNPKDGSTFSDPQNNAIVTKITSGDFCILLTSDITSSASSDLLNTQDIKCSLLQLPYHGLGKGNFNIDLFLLKVSPSYAFVSGGSYDPSSDGRGTRWPVLEKLKLRSIPYMENYKSGTIKVESDGISYSVENAD